jgi:hypothetical protein
VTRPSRGQPYWQRQPEMWAESQVADSHLEALHYFGEYAVFVLMWRAEDHAAGLVGRCPRCYGTSGLGRLAAAYAQPTERRCPECFGTTFEGGYRARIVRPSLWTDSSLDTVEHARGELKTDSMSIETTSDFTFRRGDYVMRKDGGRFRGAELAGAWVRSGYGTPGSARSVGGTIPQVRLEDPSSVAYLIPPDAATVRSTLDPADRRHLPSSFATFDQYLAYYQVTYGHAGIEDLRGPLVLPEGA